MKSLLLFNIGNTHTQWVRCDAGGIFSGSVNVLDTAAWQQDISLLPSAEDDVEVWSACVVPAAKEFLIRQKYYRNLHWVDAVSAGNAGLDFSLVDTSTLGSDRIANAAALLDLPLPAANFDCGTAITLEVVDEKRRFAGGAILPGRRLMRNALAGGTAALPEIALNSNIPNKLGCNTRDAISLGIDRGAVGMVRELVDLVKRCNVKTLVVSGGDAEFFLRALPELSAAGNAFTLRGVLGIAQKQHNIE